MTAHTVIVAIGRNIGDKPMSNFRWAQYKMDIDNLLRSMDVNVVQRPLHGGNECGQLGLWQGKVEEAATFLGVWTPRFDTDKADLKHGIKQLAIRYRQQAITLIVVEGSTHLVYAR